jgi:aspartate aminotransferase-like enzyme
VELAKHYRLRPVVVTAEWGRAVTEEAVFAAVTKQTKGILTQACESSTGAYHPIEKIGRTLAARDDILFVVDAITALGIHDIDMVRDRIDVLIGASQKALMSPAGLATVALSSRAVSRILPEGQSYYFSLKREFKAQLKGQTGFTPAISIVRALDVALEMIEKEGKKALFERHAQMQGTARRAFVDMGLALFNPDAVATKGITVAVSPKGMDTKAWIKKLRKSEGLWLAGGQGELEGKIFRLSHMGACWAEDLAWALDTIRKHLP